MIRHAKSSWEWDDLNDFERPLNDRGRKDAPVMAQRLVTLDAVPDLIVSSPAKRAKKTAQLFVEQWGKPEEEILFKSELYHAPPSAFYDVIEKLDDARNRVAIFSHNPGITAFVNELSPVRIDNMPTCGIFAIRVKIDHWKNFTNAKKEFWFFDYPKADTPTK